METDMQLSHYHPEGCAHFFFFPLFLNVQSESYFLLLVLQVYSSHQVLVHVGLHNVVLTISPTNGGGGGADKVRWVGSWSSEIHLQAYWSVKV